MTTETKKTGSLAGLAGLKSLSNLNKKISTSGLDTLKKVPIDDVVSSVQVRKTFENIEELAESIKQFGLLIPINVTRKNEDGKYVIIQGERRWRACKLAGLTTIDVIVRSNPKDDADRMLLQLSENLQRSDMSIFEIAEALTALEAVGLKNKEIAQKLGKAESFVSRALQVAHASDEIKNLCRKANIVDINNLANVIKMDAKDPQKTKELIETGISQGQSFTRTYVNALFDEVMVGKTKKKSKGKTAKNTKPKTPIVTFVIPKGVKPAKNIRYVSMVGFIDKTSGEAVKGYITPDYISENEFEACVVYNNKLTTILVQDLTYMGQCPITDFDNK